MLINRPPDIRNSEITPKDEYLDRRRFLTGLGAGLLASRSLSAEKLTAAKSPYSTTEKQNSFKDASTYNNYYEFGTDKDMPAQNAHTMQTAGWKVSVEGAVGKPKVYDMDTLLK